MKKIIIIFSCLIFLIPINLKAVEITGASYTGFNEVSIGEEYTFYVNPNISGFVPGYDNKIGYLAIYIELFYDEDVMLLQNATIPHFETIFNSENAILDKGHRLIISAFDDEDASDSCAEGLLYCGNAPLELNFFAKNTKINSTNIEIRNITLGYLNLGETSKAEIESLEEKELYEYLINNMKLISKDVQIKKNIVIKNNNSNTQVKEPEPIPPSHPNSGLLNSGNINVPKVNNNEVSKPTQTKSNNTNLSKLEIQNYQIDFNKDKKEYELTVGADVNKIIISAEAEDSKAIARVKGADDLNASGNKVTIEVLAEDNSTSTYTINIIHKDEAKNKEIKSKPKQEIKINVDKKILKLMLGILGGIILIIIIIFLSTINKRRKLNKMFNDL